MSGTLSSLASGAAGLLGFLRPATFRGIPFGVMATGKDGGRRIVTHLYPLRDKVLHEDLGRKPRILTISLILVGTGVAGRAARLEAALDKSGVGRLVHPIYGELQVTVTGWRMSSGLERGMLAYEATFEIFDAPRKKPAGVTLGASLLERLGLAAIAELISDCSALLSLEGLQEFVGENFGEALGGVADGLAVVASGYGLYQQVMGVVGILDAWTAGSLSSSGGGGVIVTPAQSAATAVTRSVAALGWAADAQGAEAAALADPTRRPDALLVVAAGGAAPALPAAAADTPSRRAEAANAAALDALVRASAAVEAARMGALVTWPSREDAIGYRDRVADALDDAADRVGALGMDNAWRAIVDLRAAWVRVVTEVAAPLPQVRLVTPTAPICSVLLAYQIDGDDLASVFERGAEISRRNQVPHPGFLAPGVPLEVLSGG